MHPRVTLRSLHVRPETLRSSARRLHSYTPAQPATRRAWVVALGVGAGTLAAITATGILRDPLAADSKKSLLYTPEGECFTTSRPTADVKALEEIADDASKPMRERMPAFVKSLQSRIVAALTELDPSTSFRMDRWERAAGGEGISCVLQDGSVLEKGGVNVSIVHGNMPPAAVRQMRARMDRDQFGWWDGTAALPYFACGISLVLHPVNPKAPTVHLNYRYFEVADPEAPVDPATGRRPAKTWWFGGGTDLTPSYLFEDDAVHFHRTLKDACDRHDASFYPRFKRWCDEYFFLGHRGEARGVGGIFFDDLADRPTGDLFAFARECGEAFLPAYLPILERRRWMRFSDHEKRWQQLRRGRYVEFNLVHDRGTKFGLATPGARVESILMSLPLTARWEYMPEIGTEADSEEEKMLDVLRNPRDWVS